MRFVKFRLGEGERVSLFSWASRVKVDRGALNVPWISEAWTKCKHVLGQRFLP